MSFLDPTITIARDPVEALIDSACPGVLAIITGVEGPSYRPLGAMMALFTNGDRAGTLSSGCIESDIALHAAQALRDGAPMALRYGQGSPFIDIQLPCGGGLDILLIPNPDRAVLGDLARARAARRPCRLQIDRDSGQLALLSPGPSGWEGPRFGILIEPPVRFLIFGKGPEAGTFAALVRSAGYPNLLLSPDPETREIAAATGCPTQALSGKAFPAELAVDTRSAIILFFHDHEWEPPILRGALETPAFYIGAQGSQRARDGRLAELRAMGVKEAALARLTGPVGLIPSARDAGTLAVSVLAEVLARAATSS